MNHFDIHLWADFARGLGSTTDRAAMQAHVSSGCARCRRSLDLMQRVAVTARADGQYEPPEHVVRWAKALGSLRRPQQSRLPRLIAHLVTNSLLDPVPAGLRAGDRGSRHALYEAGHVSIDFRLDHESAAPLTMMVGQVTSREDGFIAKAPVLLMDRKEIVAHAVSNQYGEFQLKYAAAQHLRLRVSVGSSPETIELALKDMGAEPPGRPLGSRPGTLRRLKPKPSARRRR
jgi:hypothetical protein